MPSNFEVYADHWLYYVLVTQIFFGLDLILHIVVYGFVPTLKHQSVYPIEIFIQLTGWYCWIDYWYVTYMGQVYTVDFLSLEIFLRTLRLIPYMLEIKAFA